MNFSIFGYDFTLSELIAVFCSLFLCCFYAVKTRGLKNIIKEVFEMMYKFKTISSVPKTVGQEFPTTKPVYRLNKATGMLEETGDVIVLQEVIDSCLDQVLDRTLDRLMPKVEEANDVAQYDEMIDDLDVAMEVANKAEFYRDKLGLADNLSINDIFNAVNLEAEKLKTKIDTVQALKNDIDSEKKINQSLGKELENEKKTIEKSE